MISTEERSKLLAIGKLAREIREKKGMSLMNLQLAGKLNNSTIAKIEQGKVNFTFSTLCRLAEVLETEPSELLKSL